MKIKIISLLVIVVFFNSCSKKINQYVVLENKTQKRNGKWKEVDINKKDTLVTFGKYKLGEKVGVWKTTFNGKIYQKEKIRNDISKITTFYPNGKIMEKGQTKLEITPDLRHWFYFGNWQYFSNDGKLEYIKKYHQGQKIDSISYKK